MRTVQLLYEGTFDCHDPKPIVKLIDRHKDKKQFDSSPWTLRKRYGYCSRHGTLKYPAGGIGRAAGMNIIPSIVPQKLIPSRAAGLSPLKNMKN